MGVELEVLKETRIVSFSEMKNGQIGIIVNHDSEYHKEVVIKVFGDKVVSITTGGIWANVDATSLKVRLLEVGEKIVITEN